MDHYQIKIPSNIYAGYGSAKIAADILKKEAAAEVLILTDTNIRRTGLVDKITEHFPKNLNYRILDGLKAEPSYLDMEQVIAEADFSKPDMVLAVGGGSVMDIAKLCTVMLRSDYTVMELIKNQTLAEKKLKSIMIPTTCGTGSEATGNSILAIPEQETKTGIVSESLIPDYVILDPAMIEGLPAHIVASTGIDALSHCVECYTSKKATPFSDLYALQGAKLIMENLKTAYQNTEQTDAKMKMMLGAFYGGIAITGSGTTAVHALSYPLGGRYHIPHGVSNAILFTEVMKYNQDACTDQLSRICDTVWPSLLKENKNIKSSYVISEIEKLIKVTGISTDLSKYGVKSDDIDYLTESGGRQTRLLNNNPKELSLADIRNIYLKVL